MATLRRSHPLHAAAAAAILLVGASLLALASCATVNRLDEYTFEGASIAGSMRTPPEPTVQVGYWVDLHHRSPLLNWLSLGTTFATAGQAQEAEGRMRAALSSIDLPETILRRGLSACTKTLDARLARDRRDADYLLDLDIREYGLRATSPLGSVALRIRLVAALYQRQERETVWRRDIEVVEAATPVMFGLGSIVGNIVTAEALAELSTSELRAGFERLADDAGRSVAHALEEDLYDIRYRE